MVANVQIGLCTQCINKSFCIETLSFVGIADIIGGSNE